MHVETYGALQKGVVVDRLSHVCVYVYTSTTAAAEKEEIDTPCTSTGYWPVQ